MAKPEKEALVREIKERVEDSDGIFVTEYRGLRVAEMAELRAMLRKRSADFRVLRNTLTKIAIRDTSASVVEDLFSGPTAVAFYAGDPVEVAKALVDFSKGHPALVIKGGTLAGGRIGPADIERLARIEPREVLMSKAAGAMKAPMQRAVAAPASILQKAAYVMKARLDTLARGATEGH